METKPQKESPLIAQMNSLHIYEKDIIEKFILGSGSGGQKINKTSSCVYIKHIPTSIEIKCQRGRSREANRYYARQELCEEVHKRLQTVKLEKRQLIEKKKRQNRKPTFTQKIIMRENKDFRSVKKVMRKRPKIDD